jgi:hypothetical protein
MHGEPREEGPLLHTEVVLEGVREVMVTATEDPHDHVPYFERRIYIRGGGGETTTIILRSTPGRRSTDLDIVYGGSGPLLAS